MEEELVAYLLAWPGLTARVGDRVFFARLPQGEALPAVVIHRITSGRHYVMEGRNATAQPLLQHDCYGATYTEAKAVSREVIAAYDALPAGGLKAGFVTGERDSFDGEDPDRIHRTSVDVQVTHTES